MGAAAGQVEKGRDCAVGADPRCEPQLLQLLLAAALAYPSDGGRAWREAELLLLCGCGPCVFRPHGAVFSSPAASARQQVPPRASQQHKLLLIAK